MADLKPCPFCGSRTPPLQRSNGSGGIWIECNECGSSTGLKDSQQMAAKSWNRRAASPADQGEDALRRLGNWLRSSDTGISSETMVAVFLGADELDDADAPHDLSDFGRCYRLVQLVPEVRQAFPRIAELVPAFADILREWDSLASAYERDLPTGTSVEVYERIKALRAMSAGQEGA